jgi:uncharacterized membrane protein
MKSTSLVTLAIIALVAQQIYFWTKTQVNPIEIMFTFLAVANIGYYFYHKGVSDEQKPKI